MSGDSAQKNEGAAKRKAETEGLCEDELPLPGVPLAVFQEAGTVVAKWKIKAAFAYSMCCQTSCLAAIVVDSSTNTRVVVGAVAVSSLAVAGVFIRQVA